jgi:hypothetical protein
MCGIARTLITAARLFSWYSRPPGTDRSVLKRFYPMMMVPPGVGVMKFSAHDKVIMQARPKLPLLRMDLVATIFMTDEDSKHVEWVKNASIKVVFASQPVEGRVQWSSPTVLSPASSFLAWNHGIGSSQRAGHLWPWWTPCENHHLAPCVNIWSRKYIFNLGRALRLVPWFSSYGFLPKWVYFPSDDASLDYLRVLCKFWVETRP